MKLFLQIILILIIFLKTGNLLSDNNIFNVNNISLERKGNISLEKLANQAIEEAFKELTYRVLLKDDIIKISKINSLNIKDLVKYYNVVKSSNNASDRITFSVTFDKDKIHNLFHKLGFFYSDIADKDFYILPILLVKNDVFIFSNNYYYENWTKIKEKKLIDFVLPIENIEIIQTLNRSRDNLLDLQLASLFKEYESKNIGFVLIEEKNSNEKLIYLKTRINNKIISKNLNKKKNNLNQTEFDNKIISEIKEEITNLMKSQNLIDIRTPSFLNVKMNLKDKNNLVLLKSKINNIDLIENIFIQEFNNKYVNLKIKYLGKLEKIINQLKKENISLKLLNDLWIIEIF